MIGILLLVPVFQFSAILEDVRKEGLGEVDATVSRVAEITRLTEVARIGTSTLDGVTRGVGRMIMWSNVVALNESPRNIPYRGFANFWEEVVFLNQSTLFRNATDYLDESIDRDFGLGGARLYGFSISSGGSVPFPVLADGWSRGGYLGVALFAGILCALLGFTESIVRRVYANQPHYIIAFIAILLSSSYDRMGVYGFIYNLRYLLMQLLLWGVFFLIVGKIVTTTRATQREQRVLSGIPVRTRFQANRKD